MAYAGPIAVASITLLAAAASAATAPGDPEAAVAAVFPPWWDRARVAAATAEAAGLIVREGAIGTILIVRPESPGLTERLRDAGALLVVDATAARGCLDPA